MQYLALPAFCYFLVSFTLESRLFIVVWRAQLEERQLYDSVYLRTKLTSFYFQFYFVCFVMVYF